MSKCIILSRVSSKQQELDSQTLAIKREAEKEGFSLKDMIIIEDKESAIKLSEEERNGLNKMKEAIANDSSITHVFIYELSRLSRRQLVLFSIRDYLIERNIQLICCTPYFRLLEDGKLSQTANLMFSIFASMAESEMELKKERFRRGKERNKMTGKNNSGRVLYGYKTLEDKTIVIDDETKDFVIDVFTLYATGNMSSYEVAEELHQRYCSDEKKSKTTNKVRYILMKKQYCGDSQYPAMISEELWEKCRQLRTANRRNNYKTGNDDSLLKKIIYDKKSGCHLTYNWNSGHPRYALKRREENDPFSVRASDVDVYVWELAVMLHKAYVNDTQRIRKEIEEKIDICGQKLVNLQLSLKKAQEKIDRIEERVIYGQLSKEKADKMEQEIVKEKRECENGIQRAKEEIGTMEQLLKQEAKEADYQSFNRQDKMNVIRQMISRVEVSKPKRYEILIECFTNVDGFEYAINVNTFNGKHYMKSFIANMSWSPA